MLYDLLCARWSENKQSRLRAESCCEESREEAAEGDEEIFEKAEESAGQDVSEQPEEYALSEETVLGSRQSSRHPPPLLRHRTQQPAPG